MDILISIVIIAGFCYCLSLSAKELWMIIVAIIAGLLKELYDKHIKKTYFDWVDLVCTGAGGFVAW